jgi:nucleoside-diphosphate-sugar epimerase
MKIAVVGATGRTGQQVVEQALARGDDVIAVARHPETLPQGGPGMISAAADVLDRAALAGALAGADAVVSAAGIGASRQPTAVYSEGTANILRAVDAHGISKLAVISAVPPGPRAEQPFLQRHVSIPILSAFSVLPTMTCAGWRRSCAAALRTGCLRPPRLVGKKAAGRHRIDASRPLPKAGSITYADLATALLDSLTRPDLYHRIAYVAS